MIDAVIYRSRLEAAASFLDDRLGPAPQLACILGSGCTACSEEFPVEDRLHYEEIPFFPMPTTPGHDAVLELARVAETKVCFLKGRVHGYEGFSLPEVVFSARAVGLWGVQGFILTNAAGAVGEKLSPGSLMLVADHINLLGDNPLCGPNLDGLGPRFPDMTCVYDESWRKIFKEVSIRQGFPLEEGIYAAMKGPSFETPAEVRMLKHLGVGAVGMSTVPEAIALIHMGKRVAAISFLANLAAGLGDCPIQHEDVLRLTSHLTGQFSLLLTGFVREWVLKS